MSHIVYELGFLISPKSPLVLKALRPLGDLIKGASDCTYPTTDNKGLRVHSNSGNLTYDGAGAPSGGTVNSLSIESPVGTGIMTVTGFAPISFTTLDQNVRTNEESRYLYLVSILDDATSVTGSTGAEFIEVGAGADVVAAGAGDDIVAKWKSGNLTYDGGAGSDMLSFQAQTGIVYPTTVTQALVVNLATGAGVNPYGGTLSLTGVENVVGTGGVFGITSDRITGDGQRNIIGDGIYDGGDDVIDAAGGDDLVLMSFYAKAGASYNGGAGNDELRFAIESFWNGDDAVLDLKTPVSNAGVFAGIAVSNFEFFTVSNAAVTLKSFTFRGGDGAETVTGSVFVAGTTTENGKDFLYGRGGADMLNGLSGADLLDGGAGADRLDGGEGIDVASYADAAAGVTANLQLGLGAGGEAQGDTYANIENLVGSAFNDVLVGRAGVANTLTGGNGADTFYGEGIDTFIGGAGLDTLFGSIGTALDINLATAQIETAWGGFLADTLNGSSATANLTLVGQGPTADTLRGGSGNDFVYFRNGDIIAGGTGNDWAVATLSTAAVNLNLATTGFENAWGSTSADTLSAAGASSTVVLVGDAGSDTLTGGSAGDFLYGLGDADTLNGGSGNDNLVGGLGTDLFRFGAGWGVDIVWDWANGAEKFNLAGSGATGFAQLAVNQNLNGSGNALISFGANRILVVGAANQIDAGDFVF